MGKNVFESSSFYINKLNKKVVEDMAVEKA